MNESPQSHIFQAITHSSPTTPAYSSLNTSFDSLNGMKSQNTTASNDLIERFTNRTSLDLEPYSPPLLVINDSCLDPSKQTRQESEKQADPEIDETKAMQSVAASNTTSYLGKYRRFRHKYHISDRYTLCHLETPNSLLFQKSTLYDSK